MGVCLLLSGCGSTFDATVRGNVTLDGVPLTTGTVAFQPVAGGPAAYSAIDSDGSYALQIGSERSLPPGSYRVTVSATKLVPPTPDNPEPPSELLTPPIYGDVKTTPLEEEITAGANTVNIALVTAQP